MVSEAPLYRILRTSPVMCFRKSACWVLGSLIFVADGCSPFHLMCTLSGGRRIASVLNNHALYRRVLWVDLTQRFRRSKIEVLQRRILWRCDKGKPAVRRGRKATGLIMRLPGHRTEGGCTWILVAMTSVLK